MKSVARFCLCSFCALERAKICIFSVLFQVSSQRRLNTLHYCIPAACEGAVPQPQKHSMKCGGEYSLCIAHNQVVLSLSRSESITNYANEAGKLHESIRRRKSICFICKSCIHRAANQWEITKKRRVCVWRGHDRFTLSLGTFIDHNIHPKSEKVMLYVHTV
jgi:hypothetical protein